MSVQRAAPVPPPAGSGPVVRLADVLTGLTLVNDLGMGQSPENSLRSALVATGLARHLDLGDAAVADAFYTALLQHVGCTGFAHETAVLLGGDDRAVNAAGARTDFAEPKDMFTTFLPELTRGRGLLRGTRLVAAALINGGRIDRGVAVADCEVATIMADRLGLGAGVQGAIGHVFEWWNGKGGPAGLGGDDLALPMRLTHVASTAVLFHGLGGTEAAVRAVERRSGATLDPALVDAFRRAGPDLLAEVAAGDAAEAILAAEPAPARVLSGAQLEEAARAFGEVVDLKSPYLHGHSTAVAGLAQAAGDRLGLDEAADGRLRLVGHLQDLGRVGVASGIWDKPGALTAAEREQVRLHAYHSERILARSTALQPLAALAGMHHERCDGSGYHRQTTGERLPKAACVLAAADVFAALTHDRPHRDALAPEAAAATLAAEADAGRLDPEAVDAVLMAAGHRSRPRRRTWPAGLTDRQVEVLRLVARGRSNRQIAQELVVSPRTAERHVQDIYAKIGTSSRAGAAMFAMRHALLEEPAAPFG